MTDQPPPAPFKAASEAWEAYDAAVLACHALRESGAPAHQRLAKEIEAVRLHREFSLRFNEVCEGDTSQ